MRIVFSGGGTGGHIYPALAIREALMSELGSGLESAYLGVTGGMEEKIVTRIEGLPFYGVRAQGMPRSISPKWLSFPFVNLKGIHDAVSHLRRFKPDMVVTTGGFVAFPALAAARILGIPAIIHEQNAAMGITNRIFAASARLVLLTYESAARTDDKRVFLTGNPVRQSFFEKTTGSGRFNKKPGQFWVLSVGGSRGALSLNQAAIGLVQKWLPSHLEVVFLHISGERDHEMVQQAIPAPHPENYLLLPYLHEMKEAFAVADLVISRAGATILSELAVCAKPAVLVPFPFATDNHQEKNARVLEEMGAARLLLDKDLNAETLIDSIEHLFENSLLQKMSMAMSESRPAAVEKNIARLILSTNL
ncbi:MAG: undecaprenyldiphospho-muramoylpentapeptide beta-N-acetylglucosaminyltransferase [Candidatus Riflebacteria bacterium]